MFAESTGLQMAWDLSAQTNLSGRILVEFLSLQGKE